LPAAIAWPRSRRSRCRYSTARPCWSGAAGARLHLRHLCESEEHIQHLAAIGLGVVLVPRHLPVLHTAQARPLSEPVLERSVLLAAVSGRRYSPALDAFIKLARTRDFATELAIA
jgi:DNA-binding transcriptional LysR family regulator